jgi:hypothetical protein
MSINISISFPNTSFSCGSSDEFRGANRTRLDSGTTFIGKCGVKGEWKITFEGMGHGLDLDLSLETERDQGRENGKSSKLFFSTC